jgi:hypothetical protein
MARGCASGDRNYKIPPLHAQSGFSVDVPITTRKLNRWQASGLHLLISVTIAAVTLAVMLLVWYPRPLFEASGGTGLLYILVGVDVCIGPLITLVVYKAGKRGMRFDLAVIGVLQLGALLYGTYIMFEARPVYIVLIKGQFEVVSAVELHPDMLAQARGTEFEKVPLDGPKLVYSDINQEEMQEVIKSVFAGGPDIHHRPRHYVRYEERRKEALAQAQPLEHARRTWPESVPLIDGYLAESGRKEADTVYLPGRAPFGWIIALVDAKTGTVLKFLFVSHA